MPPVAPVPGQEILPTYYAIYTTVAPETVRTRLMNTTQGAQNPPLVRKTSTGSAHHRRSTAFDLADPDAVSQFR